MILALTDFSQAMAQGAGRAWLFLPTAVLLGALHGLEPGHSKTMMAAFIVAVRGTVGQAILLGLSAAISHSFVIWALAAVALHFGSQWNAETTEPYFQLGSAVIIAVLALWMFWRTRRDARAAAAHEREHHRHDHGPEEEGAEYQDAHQAAHAREIEERFTNRKVTTPQIMIFGLTGGLLPCPAAFTVLIVCMQVKQYTLGFALVAAFSVGLALTLVAAGAAAAWGTRHARKRFSGMDALLRKAPYFSCALLLVLAAYMGWHGWQGIAALHR